MTQSKMDWLRNAIREGLLSKGMDATTLSRDLKRSKDYIRDFLDERKKTLPLQAIVQIEKVLDLPGGFLSSAVDFVEFDGKIIDVADKPSGDLAFQRPQKIYVWKWKDCGDGTLDSTSDAFIEVEAPYFLKDGRGGYGIVVEGDAMEPAYEPGDIIFIDGSLSIRKNVDVVLYSRGERDLRSGRLLERKCMIRRLVSYNALEWTVRSLQSAQAQSVNRQEWPEAHRIVGRALRV